VGMYMRTCVRMLHGQTSDKRGMQRVSRLLVSNVDSKPLQYARIKPGLCGPKRLTNMSSSLCTLEKTTPREGVQKQTIMDFMPILSHLLFRPRLVYTSSAAAILSSSCLSSSCLSSFISSPALADVSFVSSCSLPKPSMRSMRPLNLSFWEGVAIKPSER